MSTVIPAMRHVRGFDVVRPLSIGMLVFMMLPLVFLPLASIFIFGTSNGLDKFWAALMAPEAIFALKLSMATSFWATVFNVIFGLFAAYVLSRYNFWGRNALIVTISRNRMQMSTRVGTNLSSFQNSYPRTAPRMKSNIARPNSTTRSPAIRTSTCHGDQKW